jgi:hypothetical protein
MESKSQNNNMIESQDSEKSTLKQFQLKESENDNQKPAIIIPNYFRDVDKKEDLSMATFATEYKLILTKNVLEKIEQNYTLENDDKIYNSECNKGEILQLIGINSKDEPSENILKDYKLLKITYEEDTYYRLVKQREDGTIYYPAIEDGRGIVKKLNETFIETNNSDLLETAFFGRKTAFFGRETAFSGRLSNTEDLSTAATDLRDCDLSHDNIGIISTTKATKTKANLDEAKVVKINSNIPIKTNDNIEKIVDDASKEESKENIPQNHVRVNQNQSKSFFAKLFDLLFCCSDNNNIRQ